MKSFLFLVSCFLLPVSLALGATYPRPEKFNPTWPSASPGTSYSVNLPTAALLGNGSLGAVNGGDANHKLFVLTRGDFWSCGDLSCGYKPNNVRALSFADFEIGPGMATLTGTDTLDISCGVLRTEGGFGQGTVKMESYVDANEELFVVRGVSTADGVWTVRITAHGNPDEFPVTLKCDKDGFFVRRTSVDLTKGDPRGWTTNVTGAVSAIGAELTEIQTEGRSRVTSRAVVHAGKPFAFVVSTDPARRYTFAELDAMRAAHDRWWREWWSQSEIALGDEELERFYYGSIYLMGAGLRQGKAPVGLYGIWPTTDNPSWHNDYHLNYNFVGTYYGCWAANRCGVADTAADPLLAYLPQAERNAREGLKNLVSCAGHFYPNTDAYLKRRTDLAGGIPDAAHFPVALSPYGVSCEGDGSHWSQVSDGVFQCAVYCTHWEYTLDRGFLKHVWPLLDKTANFFLKWNEKETRANGTYRYLVYDSHWEGSGLVRNSAPALGSVRHLFETLVAAAPELRAAGIEVPDAKVAAWKDQLDHLSDYPVGVREIKGQKIRMLSGVERDDGVADIATCGNSVTLEGIHPGEWAAFDVTDEFRTLATNCINGMIALGGKNIWTGINQTPKLYTQAIRLGYPCQAIIDAFKTYEIRGRGQKNFHLHDNVHGVEKIGAIEFVNSMLLQCDHGFVKVFPNWTGADAAFRDLRAKGAFLVSAEMSGGVIGPVTVKALKGGTFRMVNPWPGRNVLSRVRIGKTRNSKEETLEVDMLPGQVVVLSVGPAPKKLAPFFYEIACDEYSPAKALRMLEKGAAPKLAGRCSGFRDGDFHGRNLDWNIDRTNYYFVRTPEKRGRFATIGIAQDFGKGDLELIPMAMMDGINSQGVVMEVNVVPAGDRGITTGTKPGAPRMGILMVTRHLLDYAKSAAHAVQLLDEVDLFGDGQHEMHWMISDLKETYVVEVVSNRIRSVKHPIMTNFYVTESPYVKPNGGFTPGSAGIERYERLKKHIGKIDSVGAMLAAMKEEWYTGTYTPGRELDWWSEFNDYSWTDPDTGKKWHFVHVAGDKEDARGEAHVARLKCMRATQKDFAAMRAEEKATGVRKDTVFWQTVDSGCYDIRNRRLSIRMQESEPLFEFALDDCRNISATR